MHIRPATGRLNRVSASPATSSPAQSRSPRISHDHHRLAISGCRRSTSRPGCCARAGPRPARDRESGAKAERQARYRQSEVGRAAQERRNAVRREQRRLAKLNGKNGHAHATNGHADHARPSGAGGGERHGPDPGAGRPPPTRGAGLDGAADPTGS
jgi:hypothetical protein